MKHQQLLILITLFFSLTSYSQNKALIEKVSHAEPMYMDLVRDLGARKGEREINVGYGFTNKPNYNRHDVLVEYEFAPINRLAFEVEIDFSFFHQKNKFQASPNSLFESLRLSTQYSFFVSQKHQSTLAIGYTQVFEGSSFSNFRREPFFPSTIFTPFFVGAKKWGNHVHTLIYASSLMEHHFTEKKWKVSGQVNASIHYAIPHSKHLIGVECNSEIRPHEFHAVLRPQVKLKLHKKCAIGWVVGIPLTPKQESFSSFVRLIIEP